MVVARLHHLCRRTRTAWTGSPPSPGPAESERRWRWRGWTGSGRSGSDLFSGSGTEQRNLSEVKDNTGENPEAGVRAAAASVCVCVSCRTAALTGVCAAHSAWLHSTGGQMFPSAAAVSRFNLQPSAAPSCDWLTGVPTAFAAAAQRRGHSALFTFGTFHSERTFSCYGSSSVLGLFSVVVEANPGCFFFFFLVYIQLNTSDAQLHLQCSDANI